MIVIKNKQALLKMGEAGKRLASIFNKIEDILVSGVSTLEIDTWVAKQLQEYGLVSKSKNYLGYKHVTCLSINDEVVHGVPKKNKKLKEGDLIKVDICASWKGYCADMARCFFIGGIIKDEIVKKLVDVAQSSLDKGIEKACVGNRLSDISFAIQQEVEKNGFGVVRDFAGHGIGKQLHEDPELLNYGPPGKGPVLREGMVLAIEPMITEKGYQVYIEDDGWTVKTEDGSMAAHIEDTVAITKNGPKILTRL